MNLKLSQNDLMEALSIIGGYSDIKDWENLTLEARTEIVKIRLGKEKYGIDPI